jgi:hypothetical protein
MIKEEEQEEEKKSSQFISNHMSSLKYFDLNDTYDRYHVKFNEIHRYVCILLLFRYAK